jgi:hypothetical protein
MKKIGTYTARGIVNETETTDGQPQKIPLFDGRFDTAYTVTKFQVWSSNIVNGAAGCVGKLSKNDLGVTAQNGFFRADDNNQIAWAVSEMQSDAGGLGVFDKFIIDRDNLIIEDLYVYVRAEGATTPINYLIEMDKYDITEARGALTMARDRQQE